MQTMSLLQTVLTNAGFFVRGYDHAAYSDKLLSVLVHPSKLGDVMAAIMLADVGTCERAKLAEDLRRMGTYRMSKGLAVYFEGVAFCKE